MKDLRSIYTVLLLSLLALIPGTASALELLGYYEFEGNYDDSTTNGNHAAPAQNPGEVGIVAGGFRGQGADINDPAASGGGNTGGSINIPINADPPPDISFGGWVNLDSNNGFPGFMAADNGGWDRGIHLFGNNWGIASGGNLNGVAAAPTGVWQYVVATFSKSSNSATLYVGDDSAAQTTLSGARADGAANNGGLGIIEIGRYDNQDLDARVDDVFVFDSELTKHQANAIRNLRLSALDFSPADAAALFDLFDASGSGTVNEYSWSPTAGLNPTNPGEVFDLGGGDWAVVLDDAGNGLLGHAVLAKDVIAYWPFDADFDDHGPAGNINPGTPVGAPGLSGPAKLGGALQLDGGAQQVDVANESSFDFSGGGGFTMSTWARVSSFDTNWQALVAKGEGSEFRIHRQGGGNNLAFTAGGGGDLGNPANVNDGEFHHIVAVHDPSNLTGGGNGNTFYIDGVPVFGARGDVVDNDQPLMIGENPDAQNREWEGQIDDMAFWGRPLSASDVATIFAAGQAGCSLGELFADFGACDDTGATDADTVLASVDPPTTSSLLANDIGDGVSVLSADPTSAQGAAVSVAGDGTFTYDPTAVPALQALIPGQMVFDTFDYTITDGGSEIDLLPANARFDSLTDDDSAATGFAAGDPSGPENAAGLTFQVTFTPAAGDLDSATAAVNLVEIGGDANGSGLYLLGGEVHFISKMNGAVGDVPSAFDDLDLSSGNNMIGAKSSFGPLSAGTAYTVTAIFDPITDAVLTLAVQPSGGFKVVDRFDVVGRGSRTNWSGDDSATAFRANSPDVANFGGANTVVGNAFSEAAMRGNPFEGTQGQALYWSAKGNFLSSTATVTVKVNGVNDPPSVDSPIPDQMIFTSNPWIDVPLFPHFEDPDSNHADTDLTYTVTVNTDGVLIQTDPVSSGDGILTLHTPCTLIGTADITVEARDPDGLFVTDTFTVEVKDDVAPEVITPGLVKVLAPAGQTSAVVNFTVTGFDKVDGGNLIIDCTPPSGSVFNWGATTVTCTAEDQSGNVSTSGSFTVVVKLPDDVMLESVSVGGAADGAGGVGDGTYNRIDGAHLTANGKLLVAAEVDLNKGLWSGDITGLSLVGMAPITLPPGGSGEALLAFDRYAVGENGDSGFRARLDGGGEGHWASSGGTLSEVAVIGGAVPGVAGTTFFKLPEQGWALTNSGEYFFLGQMDKADAGINEANNQGIFSDAGGLLIREGSLATSIGGGATYTNFEQQISANDAGQVAFASALRLGTVVSGGDNRAVFCGDPSSPSVVARRGDAAPGAGGAEFDSFLDVGLNAAGECVLFSRLRGAVLPDDDTGLWSDGGGTLTLVAREGAEAPGFGAATTVYESFSDAQITDGGAVVFRAEVRDTAVPLSANENEAIYVWTPGVGVELVAREGGNAPETTGVYINLPSLSVHRGGELGFNGVLQRGVGGVTRRTQHGVWVHDLANAGADPVLLVQAGDPITVGGEEETVTRPSITGAKDGGTAGRSSAVACGNVAVVVTYDRNRATTVFVMGVPDPEVPE